MQLPYVLIFIFYSFLGGIFYSHAQPTSKEFINQEFLFQKSTSSISFKNNSYFKKGESVQPSQRIAQTQMDSFYDSDTKKWKFSEKNNYIFNSFCGNDSIIKSNKNGPFQLVENFYFQKKIVQQNYFYLDKEEWKADYSFFQENFIDFNYPVYKLTITNIGGDPDTLDGSQITIDRIYYLDGKINSFTNKIKKNGFWLENEKYKLIYNLDGSLDSIYYSFYDFEYAHWEVGYRKKIITYYYFAGPEDFLIKEMKVDYFDEDKWVNYLQTIYFLGKEDSLLYFFWNGLLFNPEYLQVFPRDLKNNPRGYSFYQLENFNGKTLLISDLKTFSYDSSNSIIKEERKVFDFRMPGIAKYSKTYSDFTNCEPIGVKIREKEKINVELFPNPCTDFMQLHFKDFLKVNGSLLKMRNSNGQLVFTGIISDELFKLDTKFLSKGIYFISIEPKNNYQPFSSIIFKMD